MNKFLSFILFTAILSFSCNTTLKNILGPKTPHEKYEEKLDDKGIDDTPEGRQWLQASKLALENAQPISLPYKHFGYFAPDKSRALGLLFTAKQGEKITFTINKKTTENFTLFADIFRHDGKHLLSADTVAATFSFDADETGNYILRLQPKLFRSGDYQLSIAVGPSIAFPVAGKANVGSIWGDPRDGGKRKHEGIDIFAPKLTPAIAAADGYIAGVREDGIGGKTVWLRVTNKDYTLYYAHLDQQLVREGQFVKKGDTIGLVGNTGNAINTPSHLHFGVYTVNGAVDPLPFVKKEIKTAPDFAAKNLSMPLKTLKDQKLEDGSVIQANTILTPMAITAKGYIAELPNGKMIYSALNSVKQINANVKSAQATEASSDNGIRNHSKRSSGNFQ